MLLRHGLTSSGMELQGKPLRLCRVYRTHQAVGRLGCGLSRLRGCMEASAGSAGAHQAVGRLGCGAFKVTWLHVATLAGFPGRTRRWAGCRTGAPA